MFTWIQRQRLWRSVDSMGFSWQYCMLWRLNISTKCQFCLFLFLSEEINLCESSPCINGGTCSTLGNSYHCLCVEGFRGLNCQGLLTKLIGLINWLIKWIMTIKLTNPPTNWPTSRPLRSIDWSTDWLTVCLFDWLTDWLPMCLSICLSVCLSVYLKIVFYSNH